MGYTICIYTKGTKENYEAYKRDDFFEQESQLVEFSTDQFSRLKNRLLLYDYQIVSENSNGELQLNHPNQNYGLVYLSSKGLYFSAPMSVNAIAEISLTASEFTDTGDEFVKYDPQRNEWELNCY